jgi:hypothetical protein
MGLSAKDGVFLLEKCLNYYVYRVLIKAEP